MVHTAKDKSHASDKKTGDKNRLPIARPFFDQAEEAAVIAVLRSGWVAQGPQVAAFERSVAQFVGTEHAVAVASGTAALHLSLLAAGVRAGDIVILPSFTFVATANVVEYFGAHPIFVDIDLRTFNISPEALSACLANLKSKDRISVKAIIPVSLFGLCAEMDQINRIASEHGLTVIEDAACAFGATRGNNAAGTEGALGCFSFHPRKLITTGEGGMVVTDNAEYAEKIRSLRNHAATPPAASDKVAQNASLLPEFDQPGYNYRMTDLQGALGVEQMKKLPAILAARQQYAAIYDRLLEPVGWLQKPSAPDRYRHVYQSYVCLYRADEAIKNNAIDLKMVDQLSARRNELMRCLERSGIATRQGTHAVHTLGYYRQKYQLDPSNCPNSYLANRLSLALPLYYGITEEEQTRVADSLSDLE